MGAGGRGFDRWFRGIREPHHSIFVLDLAADPVRTFGVHDRPDAAVVDGEGPGVFPFHNHFPTTAALVNGDYSAFAVAHDLNLLSIEKTQASGLT